MLATGREAAIGDAGRVSAKAGHRVTRRLGAGSHRRGQLAWSTSVIAPTSPAAAILIRWANNAGNPKLIELGIGKVATASVAIGGNTSGQIELRDLGTRQAMTSVSVFGRSGR